MKLYVFSGSGEFYGLTENKTGDNLPSQFGPWKDFKTIEMNEGELARIGVNTDKALTDIKTKGYHVTKVQTSFTETTLDAPRP